MATHVPSITRLGLDRVTADVPLDDSTTNSLMTHPEVRFRVTRVQSDESIAHGLGRLVWTIYPMREFGQWSTDQRHWVVRQFRPCSVARPKGPTGPQDVLGRVQVRVVVVTTRRTSELGLVTPALGIDVTTSGTSLRGVAGVHCDDVPTGARSLVGEHLEQTTSPGVVDGSVEPCLRSSSVRTESSF